MNIFVNIIAILAGIFCTTPLYAQVDIFSTPPPNAPIKPEKLNTFIRDSIEEHQKKIVNVGTPYKYCLPHVCLNRMGKYALVGFDHQPLSAFEFDDIKGDWYDNAYIVRKGERRGCIDTTGKWLLPVQYPQLSFTRPGRLISSGVNSKYAFVFNFQGKSVLPEAFQFAGTMDLGSRTVIKARKELSDSLYLFDLSGNKIITYAAYDMEPLSHGNGNRYAVKSSPDQWSGTEMVVDSNFQSIAPPVLLSAFWSNDHWVYYHPKGTEKGGLYAIAAQKFHPLDGMTTPVKNHSALIVEVKGKEGLLNNKLKTIAPPQFLSIEQVVGQDLFIVRNHEYKYGLMDGQGKMVLDLVYQQIVQRNIGVWYNQGEEMDPDYPSIPTDFLTLIDAKGQESCFHSGKRKFLAECSRVVTPDLYLIRQEANEGTKEYLTHSDGRQITEVSNIWASRSLVIAVKKGDNSPKVQVYDRYGNFLKELDSPPIGLEIPNKRYYTWVTKEGKTGILNTEFNPIIPAQYDYILALKEIPTKYTSEWVKYAYRHPKHTFLGWLWNSDKTTPLLIKENGEVVSIVELD
ncbi:MAG: WG repeat-containing protein [Saprospiraceae bacterium]|nr:WG repeat-containing protein [Saprospiraceae bacterium]